MIAQLEIERSEMRSMLNGLHKTTKADDESFEDFNLIALENTNQLKIFVRHFNLFQIVHTITDSDPISVDVQKDTEMVFNSNIITKLIKKSQADRLNLRFSADEFSVETRDSWFSTPTTFTLNLFKESEFQPIANPSGFEVITSIDRSELVANLEMMSIVSNIVQFKITNNEFWISVSDAVHGDGRVMEQIDPDTINFDSFSQKYRIDILEEYLKSLDTDFVDVCANSEGVLRIKAEKPGHISELTLSPRITHDS